MSGRRQWGFGAPQPISVQDLAAYVYLNRIDHPEDVEDLQLYVEVLDSKWLELYAKDKSK